jgi:DNA-directed RNA polymerase I, II, and III subunit RPABC2
MDTKNVRVPLSKTDDDEGDIMTPLPDGADDDQKDDDELPPQDDDADDGDDEGDEGNDDDDDDDEDEEGDDEDDGGDGQARKAIKEQQKSIRKKRSNVATQNPTADIVAEEDDEDDERELMDEDYIQRVHPEAILPDSRELRSILANKDIKRRSRPILSKYEATTIVGMRAQQIAKGSASFIDTDDTDPVDIATKELRAKLIPVIVRRIMPDNVSEYWRLSELTYYE